MEKLNLNVKEEENEPEEKKDTLKLPLKRRRSSLKDEFTKIKETKKEDEELCTEVIAETMKNTLYNKVVGQIEKEN